eukprot:4122643-Amphidinium_carterae.1
MECLGVEYNRPLQGAQSYEAAVLESNMLSSHKYRARQRVGLQQLVQNLSKREVFAAVPRHHAIRGRARLM